MISKELLDILACPETKMRVAPAETALLDQLNQLIAKGELVNREGATVVDPLEEGLVRVDGTLLYPVRDEIPVMLIGESIALEGFKE